MINQEPHQKDLKTLGKFVTPLIWIIQSPITSCSRRDNSVCHAKANSILKISGRWRCGPARGWWNCTAQKSL